MDRRRLAAQAGRVREDVEQASHLLRTSGLSLEAIARKVGYEHPHTLRVRLRERTGKTTTLRGV
jgi:transcriptional regulator GlxA family with amidase domain